VALSPGPRAVWRPFLGLGIAIIALLALLPVGSADAGTEAAPSLTDNFSAADQYVESVPTSSGPKAPGVGRRQGTSPPASSPLSARVNNILQRQPKRTAAKLQRIATSPDLGAPVERLRDVGVKSSPRVPAAAVSAVGEGEQDNLLWLAIALLAITGLAAGAAVYRHYQGRKTTG
jgi:hypothetical protein